MEIVHNWIIKRLIQKNDGSGTVSHVHFKVDSTDGQYSYVSPGEVELVVNGIQNFIPYENLTEQTVIQWVKDKLGPSLGNYEEINTNFINSKRNPSSPLSKIEELPWNLN